MRFVLILKSILTIQLYNGIREDNLSLEITWRGGGGGGGGGYLKVVGCLVSLQFTWNAMADGLAKEGVLLLLFLLMYSMVVGWVSSFQCLMCLLGSGWLLLLSSPGSCSFSVVIKFNVFPKKKHVDDYNKTFK